MVYECETCEAVLTPGLIACPRCGQVFDEPVPDDAVADEVFVSDIIAAETAEPPLSSEASLPDVIPPIRRTSRSWSVSKSWAFAALLVGLVWLGVHHWASLPVSQPLSAALPVSPTDLVAHPQYASNMAVFVQKLRATGVGAEWPAFGSNDVLLITPQARVPEAPMAWTADMYRRLAQGIYGQFAQNRYESGFSETDTTACFVVVTSASGQIMAVDFMGDLQ